MNMADPRVVRAQTLHWEIVFLRQLGAHHAAINEKRREAARLLEERARELLARQEALGWTDLFAAITYWGEAGERQRAANLLAFGEQRCRDSENGAPRLRQELAELRAWLAGLRVVPSLRGFARGVPQLRSAA
jgi:hypothetical protein